MAQIQTALISTSDKQGLPEFASQLKEMGIEFLSTGGTARLLRDNDIEVTDVSDYTGFPEILDGRVKTLHPKVHGGLLAMRDNEAHMQEMEKHGIRPIDMVVVNLYPFEHVISQSGVELADAIENIDIGGPTMIRSAAKNYRHVAVVTSPDDYNDVAKELKENDCTLSEETRFELAQKTFEHTARYDRTIVSYLRSLEEGSLEMPDSMSLDLQKKQELKYGENPHQEAAFYVEGSSDEPSVGNATQVGGPAMSFNNILDTNGALELVKEFKRPAAAVIKHTNPCGAAIAGSIDEAYRKAYLGDPVSAFGSIVALNRPFNTQTAELIAEYRAEIGGEKTSFFVEVVIAPEIQEDAMKLLQEKAGWGERTRFLETGDFVGVQLDESAKDMRRIVGGMLVQDRDLQGFNPSAVECVTDVEPTEEQMEDLEFAWMCCKHVKSNAITLVKDNMLVGAGAGQMSRVDATIISIRKAGDRVDGSVLASDAFFPFPDAVEKAADAGVKAIIQPGGSKGDEKVIETCNQRGIPMVFTGQRHFRH